MNQLHSSADDLDAQKDDAIQQAAKLAADGISVFTCDQVRAAWKNSDLSHLQLISTNKKYRAVDKKTWDALLNLHLTLHPYEAEFWDCDAYSAVFVGFIVWYFDINGVVRVLDSSAGHSYNAVLVASDDGKSCSWKKVEPQYDGFVGEAPPAGITVTAPEGAYKAAYGFAITA